MKKTTKNSQASTTRKKLQLNKESLVRLSDDKLLDVNGGRVPVTIGWYTCIC